MIEQENGKSYRLKLSIAWVCMMTLSSCGSCARSSRQSTPPETLVTGRCFLIGPAIEECGYGLYSYFLLGSAPSDANRDRYLNAIAAFLRITPDVKDLEKSGSPLRSLNITYIPLVEEQTPVSDRIFKTGGDSQEIDELAKWVLRNYNYARAQVLLSSVPGGPHLDGPYFISTLKPLTGIPKITEQYLYQDLSSVPPQIIVPWIKNFISQAAQENFWEARNAAEFTLKLRASITLLADAASESKQAWMKVKNNLATLVEWKKEGSDKPRSIRNSG